jgi:hypothetical protein
MVSSIVEIQSHHAGILFTKAFTRTHRLQENIRESLKNTRNGHATLKTQRPKRLIYRGVERKVIPFSMEKIRIRFFRHEQIINNIKKILQED